MNFDLLLQLELEKLKNKSVLKARLNSSNEMKLAGYLYVRATDSWNAITEELGLRTNYEEELGEHLFALDLLRAKDAMMRELAFTEADARAYTLKRTGMDDFRTIEQEIEGYREILDLKNR